MRRRYGAVSLLIATLLMMAPQAVGGPLREMLSLQEQFWQRDRHDGTDELALAFGVPTHDVDINSAVVIEVDTAGWVEALLADPTLAADLSPEARSLLQQSAALRAAADEMIAAIGDAAELTRLRAEGAGATSRADDVRRRLQARHRAVANAINQYLATLASSPDPEAEERAAIVSVQFSDAVTGAAEDSGPRGVAAIFRVEADWTLARVAAMASAAGQGPGSLALVLSAIHVGESGTTELALPGYNDLPVGIPVPVDKHRRVPSSEDLAEMQAGRDELARWADVANRLRAHEVELEDAVRELLAGSAIDPAPLAAAIGEVIAAFDGLAAADWSAVGDRLVERIQAARSAATDAAERALVASNSDLAVGIAAYRDRARSFAADGVALRRDVRRWRDQVGEGTTADPVQALAAILGLADRTVELVSRGQTLLADLAADITRWSDNGRALRDAAQRVEAALAPLAPELRSDLAAILATGLHDGLDPLLSALDTVANEASDLRAAIAALLGPDGDEVLAALEARVSEPPDTAIDVPLPDAESVTLDLQTVWPRRDGDIIALRAWLFRLVPDDHVEGRFVRGDRVDDLTQQLQMLRFGWYSTPSVGLTYLSSFDPPAGRDQVSRSFVPQTSWMFRRRSWRTSSHPDSRAVYVPKWYDHLSFGGHAVTLDLDADNQLELGFGVTIGLWDDWFQIGAGIDVGLDDEPYYFVGTRLFELLERAGVKQARGGGSGE